MLHSRSPSFTDPPPRVASRGLRLHLLGTAALAGAAALAAPGCSDDCGFGSAPETGLVASSDAVSLVYGALTSLVGNDCPAPDAPEGVISLSIEGRQTGGTGLLTFCIPRPDLLMEGARTLGATTSTADIRVIDATGSADNCTFTLDRTQAPTGSAEATGVCSNGDAPEGFALSFDGGLSLSRTCNGTTDTVDVTLRGSVRVTRREI